MCEKGCNPVNHLYQTPSNLGGNHQQHHADDQLDLAVLQLFAHQPCTQGSTRRRSKSGG